jgi:hypothetical protein
MVGDNAPVAKLTSNLFLLNVTSHPPTPHKALVSNGKVLTVSADYKLRITEINGKA